MTHESNIRRVIPGNETLLGELRREKSLLSEEKSKLEAKIAGLKNRLRVTMPLAQYESVSAERGKLVEQLLRLQGRQSVINHKMYELFDETPSSSLNEGEPPPLEKASVIRELVNLRAEYQEYAADMSRVSTRRAMASEFVLRLNRVIKNALNRDA